MPAKHVGARLCLGDIFSRIVLDSSVIWRLHHWLGTGETGFSVSWEGDIRD